MNAFISVVGLLSLASFATADTPATLEEIEAEALSLSLSVTQAASGVPELVDAWVQQSRELWAAANPADVVAAIQRLDTLRTASRNIRGAESSATADRITALRKSLQQLDRGLDKVQRETKQIVIDKVEEGRDILLQQTAYIEGAQPEPEADACESLLEVAYSVGHASYRTINGKCYRFVPSTRLRWGYAQENCHESGMEILQIESQEEQDAVRRVMLDDYEMTDSWLGGKKFPPHEEYFWMGGSHAYFSAGYSNWASNRPSADELECVAMTDYDDFMAWFDSLCTTERPYVCELYIY